MRMTNNTYDILKKVALLYMPALETLVLALGSIWGWPYTEAITGTIAALGVCLGTCLGVSSANYYRDKAAQEAQHVGLNDGD